MTAIIYGIIKNEQIAPSNIWVFSHTFLKTKQIAQQYGIHAAKNGEVLTREVDILFDVVKPSVILKFLKDLSNSMKKICYWY